MYKGRITGKNVMEIEFRTFYTEDLFLGDILVAQDDERNLRFLLRVVDIKFGVNQSFELHDKERRLYKIGQCAPLGYIKNGNFRKPKTIPSHFSCISSPTLADFEFLKSYTGDIAIGNLRSGEDVLDFSVGVHGDLFPYHIGIFATTGMGKSNLMKILAGVVMSSGKYGILIFDPHGEYYDGGGKKNSKGLKDIPLSESRLRIYSSRKLSGPHNTLKLSAQEITLADLRQIYSFSEAQHEAAAAAEYKYGKNWLLELGDKEPEEIKNELGGNFYEATLNVLKRRAETILRFSSIHTDPSVSITRSVVNDLWNGKSVLIDTSNMYEQEELLISAVITRSIFKTNKETYQDPAKFNKIPSILIVIEEAQRVLGKNPVGELSVFAQIAREGRKFKTGLCAITQQPKLIDEELLSQFNTLFILGLADEKDRSILRGSAKQDISQLGNEIQTLMAGEALITSPETPFAIPAKIHLFEEWLKKQNVNKKSKTAIDEDFY
ncbi:MAG: ATP-binding protein [Actinobacteria bacterium]|nr:ATP-binding protein [Actinomycetota bacterium]